MQPISLYFHVPICLSKCPYCDFLSFAREDLGPGATHEIATALRRELHLALTAYPQLRERSLATIYFGGGTPSLLDPSEIATLIDLARSAFNRSDSDVATYPEVTLECNPATAEIARVGAWREAGIGRVSLGVQSFDARALAALGRSHSADEALEACRRVRAADFASWGLDLIFGVPLGAKEGADLERFRADLEQTIALAPPHVSAYGLTLHAGTEMQERHQRGEIELPGDEEQREMFLLARHRLGEAGWRHYEISNYARPGHASRHNSAYWSGAEYIGLGAGAHSYFKGRRRANPIDLRAYLSQVRAGDYPAQPEEPPPSLRSLRGERIMLALRLCQGAAIADLNARLGCNFTEEYAEEVKRLSSQGLLECDATTVRLSEEGLLLSDTVFEEFF